MTKTPVGVLAALVVAVVVAAIAAAVTLGREDEPGTDAHVHIEPISTADEVAVAAISGLHTWTPATQQSPWDAMNAIADQLTGPLAQAASTRPDPDPTQHLGNDAAQTLVVNVTVVGAVERDRQWHISSDVNDPDTSKE